MESRTVELKIIENCVTGDGFLSNDPGTDGLQICICLSYIATQISAKLFLSSTTNYFIVVETLSKTYP